MLRCVVSLGVMWLGAVGVDFCLACIAVAVVVSIAVWKDVAGLVWLGVLWRGIVAKSWEGQE